MKNLQEVVSRAALKQLREDGIANIKSFTRARLSDDKKTATVSGIGTDGRVHPVEVALV